MRLGSASARGSDTARGGTEGIAAQENSRQSALVDSNGSVRDSSMLAPLTRRKVSLRCEPVR
jgi:hypothetical protein